LKVTGSSEGFSAELALVVFLPGVNASVHNKAVLACKVLATVFALVLLFLCVDGDAVVLKIAPLPEVSSTQLALIWLVARVQTHVHFQSTSCKKTLPAYL